MSTTYYIGDPRHLNPAELERAYKFDLPTAQICTIHNAGIGKHSVIFYTSPEELEFYADDVKLARNSGGGALTMGELRDLIKSGVDNRTARQELEAQGESVRRVLGRFMGEELSDVLEDPLSDLSSLFK